MVLISIVVSHPLWARLRRFPATEPQPDCGLEPHFTTENLQVLASLLERPEMPALMTGSATAEKGTDRKPECD